MQVYGSTVMPTVRHRCLATIVKMLYFATPDQLECLLADLSISSFVASLLNSRDARAQAYGIQMAEILMEQLPKIFSTYFVKEGVAHALDELAASATTSAAAADVAAAVPSESPATAADLGGAAVSAAQLPPPSPPVTRSRRSRGQVRWQQHSAVWCCLHMLWWAALT